MTVLLDLIGFGIVLPLLPYYASDMGASPLMVGIVMASYSLMQLLFSPVWGSLSDYYGRRPLLILGLFGSAVSYLVFGLATTVAVLLVSRVLGGVMGATVPVAQAIIADSTTPGAARPRHGDDRRRLRPRLRVRTRDRRRPQPLGLRAARLRGGGHHGRERRGRPLPAAGVAASRRAVARGRWPGKRSWSG